MLGLRDGDYSSGLLGETAAALGLEASADMPILQRRARTPAGDDYSSYDALLLVGGSSDLTHCKLGVGGSTAAHLVNGPQGSRQHVASLGAERGYGLLIPKAGAGDADVSFNLNNAAFSISNIPLTEGTATDLIDRRFDSINVFGEHGRSAQTLMATDLSVVGGGALYVEGVAAVTTRDLSVAAGGEVTLESARLTTEASAVVNGALMLVDDGRLVAGGDGVSFGPTGQLLGNGVVVGDLSNAGLISAGASPGRLDIEGGLELTETSRLLIELAGSPPDLLMDVVDVSGVASLGGTLTLDFGDADLVPPELYRFLNADQFEGQFDALEILGMDPARVEVNMAGGEFIITPEPATQIKEPTVDLQNGLPLETALVSPGGTGRSAVCTAYGCAAMVWAEIPTIAGALAEGLKGWAILWW